MLNHLALRLVMTTLTYRTNIAISVNNSQSIIITVTYDDNGPWTFCEKQKTPRESSLTSSKVH